MTTETKKTTINELKTFIDAVEFAADLDTGEWVPSERQWRRIRSMIDNLVETTPQKQSAAPSSPPALQPVFTPPPQQSANRPVQMAPGGLPPPQHSSTPPPTFAGASSLPVKTPDIDTSNGSYQSTFGV